MMSEKYQGRALPEVQKQQIRETMQRHFASGRLDVRRSWMGGRTGDAFAAVLCPVGYRREHIVILGPGMHNMAVCDFGHPEAKVDIELDGLWHVYSKEHDAFRDAKLRTLGWKVIRIKHL